MDIDLSVAFVLAFVKQKLLYVPLKPELDSEKLFISELYLEVS